MKYEVGQRLVVVGGNERDRADLPDHWLIHPFEDGEEVEVLDLDHNTDEYDHPVYLVEAEDGVYGYVSEANLCCGACPPIVGGGYDCTCKGSPRCRAAGRAEPNITEVESRARAIALGWLRGRAETTTDTTKETS